MTEYNQEFCAACLRSLEDTSGEPADAHGKTYCRSDYEALFDEGV